MRKCAGPPASAALGLIRNAVDLLGPFLEDMQKMDIRWQKAQLQTILKAAHINREGGVKLEFREQSQSDS